MPPAKKIFISVFLLLLIITSGFIYLDTQYRVVENDSFGPGEKLTYRVHYSVFNAAEATMVIQDKVEMMNGRPCYKIDVFGRSKGVFEMVTKVRDNWGTYMDTAAVIPHKFYRYIEEGKYRKNEVVEFDHQRNLAITKIYGKHDKNLLKKELSHEVPVNVQDMVSGYYFLRTLDYSKYKNGDTITVKGFFDEEVFDFQLKILRRERLKTKLGKIPAIRMEPIMPDNDMFDGKNSVLFWLSDDENKIPLKIKAKMFIGAVEVDIKSQRGLKHPLVAD